MKTSAFKQFKEDFKKSFPKVCAYREYPEGKIQETYIVSPSRVMRNRIEEIIPMISLS